jgi:hypothetical protein
MKYHRLPESELRKWAGPDSGFKPWTYGRICQVSRERVEELAARRPYSKEDLITHISPYEWQILEK